jgi:hypothetical protein
MRSCASSCSAPIERLEQQQQQQQQLDRQAAELAELRSRLDGGVTTGSPTPAPPVVAAQGGAPGAPGDPAGIQQAPIPLERGGEAPEDFDGSIELAVLDSQGSVVTRRGQLTGEI